MFARILTKAVRPVLRRKLSTTTFQEKCCKLFAEKYKPIVNDLAFCGTMGGLVLWFKNAIDNNYSTELPESKHPSLKIAVDFTSHVVGGFLFGVFLPISFPLARMYLKYVDSPEQELIKDVKSKK